MILQDLQLCFYDSSCSEASFWSNPETVTFPEEEEQEQEQQQRRALLDLR